MEGGVVWISSGNNNSVVERSGVGSTGVSCVSGTINVAIDDLVGFVWGVYWSIATTEDLHPLIGWLNERVFAEGVVGSGIAKDVVGLIDWIEHDNLEEYWLTIEEREE